VIAILMGVLVCFLLPSVNVYGETAKTSAGSPGQLIKDKAPLSPVTSPWPACFTNRYNPQGANFLTLLPATSEGIYYQGEAIRISNRLHTRIEVYAFDGSPVASGRSPLVIKGTLPVNHYWVACNGVAGGYGDRSQFCVLPSDYSPSSSLGDNAADLGQSETRQRQARGKVQWIRQQVNWATVEPSQTVFDWSTPDALLMTSYTNYPVTKLLNLTRERPDWEITNDCSQWILDMSNLWLAAAQHYVTGVFYEISNEPYKDYIPTKPKPWWVNLGKAIQASVYAIRSVSPRAVIWAPSTQDIGAYAAILTNAEVREYYAGVDGISWHDNTIAFGPPDEPVAHPESTWWNHSTVPMEDAFARVSAIRQWYPAKTLVVAEAYPVGPDPLGRRNRWCDNPYCDNTPWIANRPLDWRTMTYRYWKWLILTRAAGVSRINSENGFTCCLGNNNEIQTGWYGWYEKGAGTRVAGPKPAISGQMMIEHWLNGGRNVTNWISSDAHYSEWIFPGPKHLTFAWASELTTVTNSSGAFTTDIYRRPVTGATLTENPVILWNWPPP
jgi:hypothetical protein